MKHAQVQCAYITGGSSGIGFAIAEECWCRGADVLLIARDETKLARAASSLETRKVVASQKVGTLSVDVSSHEDVDQKVSGVVRSFGPPDLLVNCAGIPLTQKHSDIDPVGFATVIATNLTGAWNMIHIVLPHLKRPGGTIVNVSSVAGFVGTYGYTAYSASKFGLVGMSEALRSELRPEGVRVTVLCPPDTDTPQLAAERAMMPAETRAVNKYGCFLTPEQVARALFRGLARKRFMVIPGFNAKYVYVMKRLLPAVVTRVMDVDIRRERKRHE